MRCAMRSSCDPSSHINPPYTGTPMMMLTSTRSSAPRPALDPIGRVTAQMSSAMMTLASKVLASAGDAHTTAAIDNSDQFVLRFKKPTNASAETKRPKNDPLVNWYENTQVGNIEAKGTVSGNRPRWSIYHKDGSYEEMGPNNPLQEGTWFWDAAGHNCMLHQFPATQRQFIVCHDYVSDRKVGEVWEQRKNKDGSPNLMGIYKGYVYPALPAPEEIEKGF